MNHNKYIIQIAFVGLVSTIAWIMVVMKFDPFESTALGLIFFMFSLFLGLSSIFCLLGFYLRKWLKGNEIYYNHINIALRQGVLLSLCFISALVFLFLGILTWWSGLLLVAIITLIEFYFVSVTTN